MKKIGVLNQEISEVIAGMGHGDFLVIGDAGLPIPAGTRRIDLALCAGTPGFTETLCTILSELQVEKVAVASETESVSPELYREIRDTVVDSDVEFISHEELKERSRRAVAIVRTGEFTPYANIILYSGVVF